jgi:formylmethanofuran--tetrahydromethanopterin N-formyltransferase
VSGYALGDTLVDDTFAEAFPMRFARLVITAATGAWALEAARSMTGFATSVIGCKCEAAIERVVRAEETPDGRPGIAVLLFAMDREGVGKRVLERVGQCVMTCPTTACFDGFEGDEKTVPLGATLRYFGDGFQASKVIVGKRFWRIPVMEGEFVVQEKFGMVKGVGGGNFLILARTADAALAAAEAAVDAMHGHPGTILPFPGGVVRSGSKVGSRRIKSMIASTNDAYCPTLRAVTTSALPDTVNSVLELVINGTDADAIASAMRAGIDAACRDGVVSISAGNYGGKLGPHHFHLRKIMAGPAA